MSRLQKQAKEMYDKAAADYEAAYKDDKRVLVLGKAMVSIRLNEGMPCLPPFGPIRPGA